MIFNGYRRRGRHSKRMYSTARDILKVDSEGLWTDFLSGVFWRRSRARISKKIKTIIEKGITAEHELVCQIEKPHKIAVSIVIAEGDFKDSCSIV